MASRGRRTLRPRQYEHSYYFRDKTSSDQRSNSSASYLLSSCNEESSDSTLCELDALGGSDERQEGDEATVEVKDKPADSSEVLKIQERAKALGIDVNTLILSDALKCRHSSPKRSEEDLFKHARRALAPMESDEDIFSALYRFEVALSSEGIPEAYYMRALKSFLTGSFRNEYFDRCDD